MNRIRVAKVAVEKALYHFDKVFDYRIPETMYTSAVPGCRVLVPFGMSNVKRLGMILEICELDSQEPLKELKAVLDPAPLLTKEMLENIPWIKSRCFCTLFDAVKLWLPLGIQFELHTLYQAAELSEQQISSLSPQEKDIVEYIAHRKKPVRERFLLQRFNMENPSVLKNLAKKGILSASNETFRKIGDAQQKMLRLKDNSLPRKLTEKQKQVVALLEELGEISAREACYYTGVTPAVIQTLIRNEVIEPYEVEIYRSPYEDTSVEEKEEPDLQLSPEQQQAYEALLAQYMQHKAGVSLLYGVTGSGKTSVFMKLIDYVASQKRGVIVMVPEISLTPQVVGIFRKRYGNQVAVFHSGLSLGERLDEWKRVRNGQAQIAVGTRSAVFAPFQDVGLIVMDEEQEHTYKSESSPRYHARDVAKFRCAYHKTLLLLSSATPSVESYYYALEGRYQLNVLPSRYGAAQLPEVSVADMNQEMETGNTSILSRSLYRELQNNLLNGKQSILLLNRRGYHTFVSCRSCGHVVTCPNCSISLTFHAANQRLMCHYCGYSVPFSEECPQCHEKKLRYSGSGTQKAEEELRALLPQARILRMDTDSNMAKFSYERKLSDFAAGKYDIIIGTQMVAKGLDFENVTLVGVLCADQSLYSDDFRSYERSFDLLTQVVGRSGRGKYKGKAWIQTYTPENEIFQLAATQDYSKFYEGEIQLRKAMLYPPFSDICVISFSGESEGKTAQAAREFSLAVQEAAQKEGSFPLRMLHPIPASVAKISGKYRYKLILKCRNTLAFRTVMEKLLKEFSKNKVFSAVSIFADMNPDTIA